jgi:Sec-independent protein translocase protein TatA
MKNQYSVSGFKSEMSTIQQQINNINNQQQQQQQLDDQQQQQQNMMQAVSMGQVIIFQQSGIE